MIAAMSINRVIGNSQGLIWHMPRDLKHFKDTTINSTIVVGKNTFFHLPPLKNRRIIVLSSTMHGRDGISVSKHPELILKRMKKEHIDKIFVAGGAQVYHAFMPYMTDLILSKIHVEVDIKDDTVFFPYNELPLDELTLEESHYYNKDDSNPYRMTILHYRRDNHAHTKDSIPSSLYQKQSLPF